MSTELVIRPLAIAATWRAKMVTTDPPRLVPHQEWRLEVEVTSSEEIEVASLVYFPDRVEWATFMRSRREDEALRLSFFPFDWASSDEVQINWNHRRVNVSDGQLKEDPRAGTYVSPLTDCFTGAVIEICQVVRHDIRIALFAVVKSDTETRRGRRWRVRPALTEHLPAYLHDLSSGKQSGSARL